MQQLKKLLAGCTCSRQSSKREKETTHSKGWEQTLPSPNELGMVVKVGEGPPQKIFKADRVHRGSYNPSHSLDPSLIGLYNQHTELGLEAAWQPVEL